MHHYIIHGFEGSTFAKDAWPSCEKYSQLVTNIPHALHMPGHIYSQTGRWSDAEKSFGDAAGNERKWMAQDKLYGDGHHGHNVHYLATAYSFEGRYDDAIEAAKELLQFKENPAQLAAADGVGSARAQGWFAMLRTLVQFEKWDAILAGRDAARLRPRPRQEAWRHWARALAFANTANAAKAREELAQFDEALPTTAHEPSAPTPPNWKWRARNCWRTWNWPTATPAARSSSSNRPARRNAT